MIWLGDKGLVITILTCNLTSTPQGLDTAEDALITFCFTRVSCDIQIRQLINDIKCGSALADCVPLSRRARVINIRILLKATSCFSPSLHYVWIFTSRIFQNNKLSGLLSLSLSELEITITTIPIGPFVVILSQIKELVIKILEMILRFYTYVIPSFKIDGIRSSQSPNQLQLITCLSLVLIFLSWSSMRRTRWPPKSSEFICRYLWVIPGRTSI